MADLTIVTVGHSTHPVMTEKSAKPHTLTSFAHVDGERIWYPAG
ncbi:MAG TPA: hypothetical protein VF885_26825 [Arthrobacter sp.]